MLANAMFCLVQRGIVVLFGIWRCKIFLVEGGLHCREHEEMTVRSQRKNVAEIHNSAICQTGH
jgi:hypothetical protein